MVSEKKEKINYKFHIIFILSVILLQAFSPQIFITLYQPILDQRLKSIDGKSGDLYGLGEYRPLSKEVPTNYRYVFVEKSGELIKESYFLPNLDLTVVSYQGGNWISTATSYRSTKAFLFLPSIGFFLIFFAIFSHSIRTNQWFTFYDFWKYPFVKREKISLIYGVPMFISAMILSPKVL